VRTTNLYSLFHHPQELTAKLSKLSAELQTLQAKDLTLKAEMAALKVTLQKKQQEHDLALEAAKALQTDKKKGAADDSQVVTKGELRALFQELIAEAKKGK
jgi:hypothetical protein